MVEVKTALVLTFSLTAFGLMSNVICYRLGYLRGKQAQAAAKKRRSVRARPALRLLQHKIS